MDQSKVVNLGDTIEISVHDELGKLVSGPKKYTVTLDNLRDAVAIVKMRLGDIVPDRTMLLQNYPNPFNPETWIPYQLANSSEVSIRIYEISGRLVQILNIGQKDGGVYLTKDRAAYWDGKNDMGELVASGVYFYTIETGDYRATRKMMIMK